LVTDLSPENITGARELSNVKRFFFELAADEFKGFDELAKQAAESSHGRKPVDQALYETPSPRGGRQILAFERLSPPSRVSEYFF